MSRFIMLSGLRPHIAARVAGGVILALLVLLLAGRPAQSGPDHGPADGGPATVLVHQS
jgi:hypothetical protein